MTGRVGLLGPTGSHALSAPARMARQAWLLTLVASTVVVSIGKVGPDWPAQEFRAALAHDAGLLAWNDSWYAGHALPGYSVLYPLLSSLLGAGLTGLLAATATAWAGSRLVAATAPAGGRSRPRNTVALHVVIAVWVVGNLIIGQVPFLLGAAAGVFALLNVQRRRPWLAAGCAAGCALASPLAGFFLALIAVAWWRDIGWRRVLPFAATGCGTAAAFVLGGSSGPFPFDAFSYVTIAIFCVAGYLLIPSTLPTLRRFVIVFGAAGVVLLIVPNPVGGNLSRLGELTALPLALWTIGFHGIQPWRRARARTALCAAALAAAAAWQIMPVVSAVARSTGDPSSSRQYYSGLLTFLAGQDQTAGRLEIPFSREHWEAAFVAPHFPLARGWERQLDLAYNDVLYHPLTPAGYHAWLSANAVDLVALPNVPLDYGGTAERTLLAHPPAYLRMSYQDRNWKVYRVSHATPLLTGASARLLRVAPSSFTVRFFRAGIATVRIHDSSLWQTSTLSSCLAPSVHGWLRLRSSRPAVVTVTAEVTPAELVGLSSARCST